MNAGFNRLLIIVVEDIGIAVPGLLKQVEDHHALYQRQHRPGQDGFETWKNFAKEIWVSMGSYLFFNGIQMHRTNAWLARLFMEQYRRKHEEKDAMTAKPSTRLQKQLQMVLDGMEHCLWEREEIYPSTDHVHSAFHDDFLRACKLQQQRHEKAEFLLFLAHAAALWQFGKIELSKRIVRISHKEVEKMKVFCRLLAFLTRVRNMKSSLISFMISVRAKAGIS